MKMKLVYNILFICIIIFAFLLGMVVEKKGFFPSEQIKSITRAVKNMSKEKVNEYGEDDLIANMFTESTIAKDKLLYEPVDELDEFVNLLDQMEIDISAFPSAYDSVKIINGTIINNVLNVEFEFAGKELNAYGYFKKSEDGTADDAALIIPGTGENQSTAMFNNVEDNYQANITELTSAHSDSYILIKPNEDILAIHNGNKKINETAFVNYLLNNGASYSFYYFVQSLAISKYLQQNYDNVIVAGLSQGGFVSLLNGLQSQPYKCIVASGYSILFAEFQHSGHDQFIVPYLWKYYTNEQVKERIAESKTRFLFTYGFGEDGIYLYEAGNGLTAHYFADLKNAAVKTHNGGHVYPDSLVANFLAEGSIQ